VRNLLARRDCRATEKASTNDARDCIGSYNADSPGLVSRLYSIAGPNRRRSSTRNAM
jgi:hypothetical protein